MKILIISSLSPFKSGNYGKRLIDTFVKAGYETDYLTKYKFEGMGDNMYSVYDEEEPKVQKVTPSPRSSWKYYLCFKYPLLDYIDSKRGVQQSVINLSEEEPEVDASLVCSKIVKHYDAVYITFWQFMLTTKTIKMIYEKLRVPIFLSTVDMFPMTGGCYYFGSCNNYQNECRKCPASKLFKSPEIPHNNFVYKRDVYKSTNCIYFCNKWMRERILKAGIIDADRIRLFLESGNPVFMIDDKKSTLREELHLPQEKFVIFAGAANVRLRRKGFNKMARAVNLFVKNNACQDKVLIVLAGRNDESFQKYFNAEVRHVGFLSTENLAKMYRAADLYLSPSLEDAGPSMVVQSLSCGTPVIAFEMGVAPEEIMHKKTGYIARLGDVKDFVKGISLFYHKSKDELEAISVLCRKNALEARNPSKFIEGFKKLYEEFKDKNV